MVRSSGTISDNTNITESRGYATDETYAYKYNFGNIREINRERAVGSALDLIYRKLKSSK